MSNERPTGSWGARLRAAQPLACVCVLALVGCEDDTDATQSDGGRATGLMPPSELAITADWLQQTLSYVDLGALRSGATERDAVVTDIIELPDYAPGPLQIELTPDGTTALVSVSGGFFRIPGAGLLVNASMLAADEGTLLFVDVDTGQVSGSLDTGDDPMGIAITPDGAQAFVAHFSSGNIAVVDVPGQQVTESFDVGVYAEEIALDDTGSVGIVGYSTDGSVRTFGVADPSGSLSPQVQLDGDSAGVAFFPGTKKALVVQAPNPLSISSGYTLVDASDPSAPVVLEDVRFDNMVTAYPAVSAPARGSVIVPSTVDGRLVVREYVLEAGEVSLKQSIDVTEANLLSALGVNYDGDRTVVMTLTADRTLAVADLDSGEVGLVPWPEDRAGPADVVIRPAPRP